MRYCGGCGKIFLFLAYIFMLWLVGITAEQ
jgi:hypothetical protein